MNPFRAVLDASLRNKRLLLHFVVVSLIIVFYWRSINPKSFRPVRSDSMQYTAMGYNLAKYGTLSRQRRRDPEPDNYRPPGFPASLAAAFVVDPRLRELGRSQLFSNKSPFKSERRHHMRDLYYLQHLFLVLAALLAMYLVMRTTDSMLLSWISLFVMLSDHVPTLMSNYANRILSETLAMLLVTLLACALFLVARKPGYWQFLLAGITLGCLTLTRASYYYFIPVALLLFAWIAWRSPENRRRIGFGTLAFAACLAVTIGPWMLRNYYEFGRAMIARRGGHLLRLRSEMNMMTTEEYYAAFWYWTPPGDFRDFLQPHVDTSKAQRFKWRLHQPEATNFQQLNRNYRERMTAKFGATATDRKLKKEAIDKIVRHPVRHLAACLPIGYRGLMVSNVPISFVLFVSFFMFILYACWTRNMPLLFLISPSLFTFAFHTFLTHGLSRYNVPMIPTLIVVTLALWFFMMRGLFRMVCCRLRSKETTTNETAVDETAATAQCGI